MYLYGIGWLWSRSRVRDRPLFGRGLFFLTRNHLKSCPDSDLITKLTLVIFIIISSTFPPSPGNCSPCVCIDMGRAGPLLFQRPFWALCQSMTKDKSALAFWQSLIHTIDYAKGLENVSLLSLLLTKFSFLNTFQEQKVFFKCKEGHSGQFVYIRDDRPDKEYFGLCEVEVFHYKG